LPAKGTAKAKSNLNKKFKSHNLGQSPRTPKKEGGQKRKGVGGREIFARPLFCPAVFFRAGYSPARHLNLTENEPTSAYLLLWISKVLTIKDT